MANFGITPLRFGRRGASLSDGEGYEVSADNVRRGVEALNALSYESRRDPEARQASLFYALRHARGPVALDQLVPAIDLRIAAFERMLAAEPGLIARDNVTAALENAVYEAIASEPLVQTVAGPGFDAGHFSAALPLLLRREVARQQQASRPTREQRPKAFWIAAHI
jgi:hypothetical protein